MVHDYHTHTTYSDGMFPDMMASAAEDIGLDGIGFADHCIVSDRRVMEKARQKSGFMLHQTYDKRRKALERLRDDHDIAIHDAVEMDYHPDDEDGIASFLDEAGFDYVVGSVHTLEAVNVHRREYFRTKSAKRRDELIDTYFEKLDQLIRSGLIDIAAHIDVFQRNPALRGKATRQHYTTIAEAFSQSDTVPEINAGRATEDYGRMHPNQQFFAVLQEYGVEFTIGSDAHTPDQLEDNHTALETFLAEHDIEPTELEL